jgi:hypothetical protein
MMLSLAVTLWSGFASRVGGALSSPIGRVRASQGKLKL